MPRSPQRFSDQEIAKAGASVTAIRVENFPSLRPLSLPAG